MQQKIFLGLVLTLIIVIFIPFYWATESGRQEMARERVKAETVGRGAELYTLYCAVCHGLAGEGRIGPALKGSPLDENVLNKIIARGIPGTAMPAMASEEGGSLKRYQISDLVTFIKNWDQSLIKAPSAPPAAAATPPAPALTPTSPSKNEAALKAKGEEIYQKTAGGIGCKTCHGTDGKGIPNTAPDIREASAEDIRRALGGDAMSFISMTDEDIEAVATYIKYLQSQP